MPEMTTLPATRLSGMRRVLLAVSAPMAIVVVACSPAAQPRDVPAATAPLATPRVADAQPSLLPVEVIARYPHDPQAFTQGLLVDDDVMYESTGREGLSDIRRVEISTGRVLARRSIDTRQFGEGMARWRDRLISLTWTEGIAWQWQLPEMTPLGSFHYEGEGWGLTATDTQLIQSDGSAVLSFRNPETFAVERTITVHAGPRHFDRLNELEYVDGRIWANIWMTPFIAVIDPADGRVTHMLDARSLVQEMDAEDGDAVLNGIAYDRVTRRLYVTGKLWPTLFEIRKPDLN